MDARKVLTLLAGCLMLAGSRVTGETIRGRASERSNGSRCLKTIITNDGDTTKFSFEVNHPAVKVTHCQQEAGERESWTIQPVSSGDRVQGLNINPHGNLNNDGKDLTNTNSEWEKKMDMLLDIGARLEKRMEEIVLSSTGMVSGYEKLGNLSGRYKMHAVGMTWVHAKATCEKEKAHLLVINSAEERAVVPALFTKTPNIQCADWDDSAWIGVHDNMTEGDFWTVLGERLSTIGYAYWDTGRPVLNTKENCVTVDMWGAMYDSECDYTAPFICEM